MKKEGRDQIHETVFECRMVEKRLYRGHPSIRQAARQRVQVPSLKNTPAPAWLTVPGPPTTTTVMDNEQLPSGGMAPGRQALPVCTRMSSLPAQPNAQPCCGPWQHDQASRCLRCFWRVHALHAFTSRPSLSSWHPW